MGKLYCCAVLTLILAAVLPTGILWAQHNETVAGSFPLLSAGLKWGFTLDQIPDLRGKTALVTGANVGLGRTSALRMAQNGAHVIMVCRSSAKCDAAKAELERELGPALSGSFSTELMDLSSFASVTKLADKLLASKVRLDIVMLNAGLMATPFGLTEDGIEQQMGAMHMSHTLFLKKLLPKLQAQAPAPVQVAVLSSMAHWFTGPDGIPTSLEALNDKEKYDPNVAYSHAKLANIYMTQQIAEELGAASNVYVNAVHPGAVLTDILRYVEDIARQTVGDTAAALLLSPIRASCWSVDDGVVTQLYVATAPEIIRRGFRGEYFVPQARKWVTSPQARDAKQQREFWEFTLRVLKDWL